MVQLLLNNLCPRFACVAGKIYSKEGSEKSIYFNTSTFISRREKYFDLSKNANLSQMTQVLMPMMPITFVFFLRQDKNLNVVLLFFLEPFFHSHFNCCLFSFEMNAGA